MKLLSHFPPEAVRFALDEASGPSVHLDPQAPGRLCGRCLALTLIQGYERYIGADLPDYVDCARLTAPVFVDLYLRVLAARPTARAWRDYDLGVLARDLVEFTGWVSLSNVDDVLARIEHYAQDGRRHV
jgi:hypothetical protein